MNVVVNTAATHPYYFDEPEMACGRIRPRESEGGFKFCAFRPDDWNTKSFSHRVRPVPANLKPSGVHRRSRWDQRTQSRLYVQDEFDTFRFLKKPANPVSASQKVTDPPETSLELSGREYAEQLTGSVAGSSTVGDSGRSTP